MYLTIWKLLIMSELMDKVKTIFYFLLVYLLGWLCVIAIGVMSILKLHIYIFLKIKEVLFYKKEFQEEE